MVNYKRLVCEATLLALLATAALSAPTDLHYDQRQTGAENYRLNIDGVVFAVVPADAVLAAMTHLDVSDLLEDIAKPPSKPTSWDLELLNKPSKPTHSDSTTLEAKPEGEEKPQDTISESQPLSTEASLSDVSLTSEIQKQRKDTLSKREAGQRLKNRLAHLLLPLLRKTRQQ